MSYFSFRVVASTYRIYDLHTQPSRAHTERLILDCIRRSDPFQSLGKPCHQ